MNLILAQKEIKELQAQVSRLQVENQELKQKIFYGKYMTEARDVQNEINRLQDAVESLRADRAAIENQNEHYRKQIEILDMQLRSYINYSKTNGLPEGLNYEEKN